MSSADRSYDLDAFLENLRYLEAQGRESAKIPEISGVHHEPPPGGHPLIDIVGLQKRLLEATPDVTLRLSEDVTMTIRKTDGGAFVSVQGRF